MKKRTIFIILAVLHCGMVMSQSLGIDEIKRRITPAHELLREYEQLKFDVTPAGIKAAEERAAEEARIAAERAEQQRKETEERRIAEAKRIEDEKRAAAEKTERERREAEERRIAEEKQKEEEKEKAEAERKAKRAEMEKNAILFNNGRNGNEYTQSRGFKNVGDMLTFGRAILKEELEQAKTQLRNAGPFDDKVPLQQTIDAVNLKIRREREAIARETFFNRGESSNVIGSSAKIRHNTWIGLGLLVDLPSDKASFTMHFRIGDRIAVDAKPRIYEDISLFHEMGITATKGKSFSYEYIDIHVSGNVASIRELWENGNNYEVRAWFNNLRRNDGLGSGAYGSRADVIAIDIIKK